MRQKDRLAPQGLNREGYDEDVPNLCSLKYLTLKYREPHTTDLPYGFCLKPRTLN